MKLLTSNFIKRRTWELLFFSVTGDAHIVQFVTVVLELLLFLIQVFKFIYFNTEFLTCNFSLEKKHLDLFMH